MSRLFVFLGVFMCLSLASAEESFRRRPFFRNPYKKEAKSFGVGNSQFAGEWSTEARRLDPQDQEYLEDICSSISKTEVKTQCLELIQQIDEPEVMNIITCTGCKLAVKLVMGRIPSILEKIKQTVLPYCSKLPTEFQEACRKSIPLLVESIAQYVQQNLSPEKICTIANQCP